ncbi:rhomboid family intramembrane serine protease [Escherichia coli]|uniref:rhomboid family intramembrane serine protease n=1 Tax=Escherichia coli TaxID=562 RepID=UPI0010747502|nr:rhomboid family intramembrane serine protease [Escherichia coli]TFS92057.1 rhomboid family intramembrane serine protease [Escherichia coli]
MLMITSFANPRVAQAFVDYMATQGVILTIQQHNQSDVWLADESQAERVRAELARFLENPADPRYLAASWQSGHTDSGLHYRRYPFFAALRERAGPVTWVMMIACVVVYALMGYVWLRGERDPQSGIYLQRGLIIFALIWIVAGWFDLFGMSMANGAHIAGLAVGLAMAFVDSLNARKRK